MPVKEKPPTTEAVMMEYFHRALLRESRSREVDCRLLIPEFDGVLGRPDLVDARIHCLPSTVGLDALADSLSSPTNARILAHLKYRTYRNRERLEKMTGFSSRSLNRNIHRLEDAGIVEVQENSAVSLSCPLPPSMVNIVAYEGKLSNWRRALHQAIGYRSFSHSVRVIMPASAARHARKLERIFRINGIGLIAIESDGVRHVVIKSRKQRPASRRLYLMAVGIVLRKFVDERRRLHRRLKPECIQCI